tara:strand:+ start:170 stop:1489 length:1320 start_codon:yes stop_codon:yes gene_type:complete
MNQNRTISLRNLFLVFIVSGFVGLSVSFGDFYLYHLCLVILLFLLAYSLKEDKYKLRISLFSKEYIRFLIFLFIWYVVSLLWTPDLILGLKYIFYIFCGITLVMLIVYFADNISNLNKLFKTLSIFFIIEIIISLLESFTGFRMPTSSYSSLATLLGKDPINYSQFDNLLSFSNYLPPTGLRWNTNDLAICMIIGFPFFLCSKKIIIKFFGIVAITTIIIMTASRAVFLGLLLSYSLYLVFIKKKIGTLVLVWGSSTMLILGMLQLRDSENPRLNELANSVEALTLYISGEIDVGGSLEWRRKLVENGLVALYNSNGLGIGAGGSVAHQEAIGAVAGRFTSMHNFWVELIVEGGILVGLIVFSGLVLIISRLFFISRFSLNADLKYYSESSFLSMIALIPSAIAASSVIYLFPVWIILGVSISIILIYKNNSIHNSTFY